MTSASPTTKIVDFVQRGSGTTLFAPRNMSDISSNVSITNGTLEVGRDSAKLRGLLRVASVRKTPWKMHSPAAIWIWSVSPACLP